MPVFLAFVRRHDAFEIGTIMAVAESMPRIFAFACWREMSARQSSLALCVNEASAMLACVAIAGVLLVPFARDRPEGS